ncbi:MAG: dephospho-CoA kinase [Planctomycetes bacterium]|nr:dephospho-CoA kinase [Planctomycetota bacterium]
MTSETFSIPESVARRIPVIGIVGGIGSGKSEVTRWVARHANVTTIDADLVGHQVLRWDTVKAALRQRFGQEIFDSVGEIQRGALARRVFGDGPSFQAARHDLERIVHPAIEQQIVDVIAAAAREERDAVLLDAAVLLEAGWQKRCDAVVFVDAPDDVRLSRVSARSGWSLEELQKRESSQLPLSTKKQRSNLVISNAADDSRAGEQLLDFLLRMRGNCCKPLPNPSQQS